jgi:predicted PilT family ATPase
MVQTIVPAAVDVNVPIFIGFVKEPLALLICAVNTLPVVKVPDLVKDKLNVEPAHFGDATVPVAMVCEKRLLRKIITKKINEKINFIVTRFFKL